MAEQPINLNRTEVKELWEFVTRVDTTLTRVDGMLDNHEARLRTIEQRQAGQAGAGSFARWIWPIIISLGAFLMSILAFIKRAI